MLNQNGFYPWVVRCVGNMSIVFIMITGLLPAEVVNKFQFQGLPETLMNKELQLHHGTVAKHEYVYVGNPSSEIFVSGMSSVFFIIDHSSSMKNMGQDPQCSRYIVALNIIDSIYKTNPKSEVGVAVFGTSLWYLPRDNPLFKPVTDPGGVSGGYIPLLTLDSVYTEYQNMTGVELLRKWLAIDTFNGEVDLVYRHDSDDRFTNITYGFYAAKQGFKIAKYPKDRHFCIFFSDGNANYPQSNPDEYVEGTNVPTTFTVFFTSSTSPPQTLQTMTENIKVNDYSNSNPKSNIWSIQTSVEALQKLINEHVIGNIIGFNLSYTPLELKINDIEPIIGWDSTGFTFAKPFPLIGKETPFHYVIKYNVKKDSVLPNGTVIQVSTMDTIIDFSFKVILGDTGQIPPKVQLYRWDRSMQFFYNNAAIDMISDPMKDIEIRFGEQKVDVLYGYKNVGVVMTHTTDQPPDVENFSLKEQAGFHGYTFARAIGPAKPGDGILQHSPEGKVLSIFRNPELVLDTLRTAIPVNLVTTLTVNKGIYFDNDAEGFIDSLFIGLSGGSAADNVDEIMDAIDLPDFRKFTVERYKPVNGGIAVTVTEKASQPQTYVIDDDKLVVKNKVTLPNGNTILEKSETLIIDSVAPIIMKADFVDSIILVIQGSQQFISEDNHNKLSVVLSETVEKIEEEKPFTYYSISQSDTYEARLKPLRQKDNLAEFRVLSINGADAIVDGDSIRINWVYDENVMDEVGNNQDNSKNIRREINAKTIADTVYKSAPFELIVKATLFDEDIGYILNDEITAIPEIQEVVKYLKTKNGEYKGIMIITLEPDPVYNVSELDHYEGYLNLFDAVGNEIIRDVKMGYHEKNKQLIYVWDGRNHLGRLVGSGAYAAVIPVTYYFDGVKERSETKMCVIGVKK